MLFFCVYTVLPTAWVQIGDKSVGRLTRAEVFELLDLSFMKNDSVQMTVFYDAKSLSQLPPHAKDNFYVRCVSVYICRSVCACNACVYMFVCVFCVCVCVCVCVLNAVFTAPLSFLPVTIYM